MIDNEDNLDSVVKQESPGINQKPPLPQKSGNSPEKMMNQTMMS